MPFFIPALIAGASALAGVLGNRAKKQTQTSESTTTRNMLTAPEYGEKEALVKDRILNELLARSEADTDLSGYSALGLGNIAKGQSAKKRAMESFLASRGLGGSPMAAHAMSGLQGEQIGAQTDFLNTLPLLQRNMQRESMGDLSQFFSSLPVAQRTTGTDVTKGTQTQNIPSNMLAGGLTAGIGTLANLYGQGAFSKGSPAFTGNNSPSSNFTNDILSGKSWNPGYNTLPQPPEVGPPPSSYWGNSGSAWNKGF